MPCPARYPLFGPETACAESGLNTKTTHSLSIPALAALLLGALLFVSPAHAQTSPATDLWQPVEQTSQKRASSETWVQPKTFRTV